MTLKVIGTGFDRTGTDSMREALGMLGFGPCHHMFEVNTHEDQKRLWRAFVRGTSIYGTNKLRRPTFHCLFHQKIAPTRHFSHHSNLEGKHVPFPSS